MQNFLWFLLLTVIVGGYFWLKSSREKQHYSKLSPIEKLWWKYTKLNPLCDAAQILARNIEDYLQAEMKTAKTETELKLMVWDFLAIDPDRKGKFWKRAGSPLSRYCNDRVAAISEQDLTSQKELDHLVLIKVMQATTHEELNLAEKSANPGSAVAKAIPLVREEISMVEYDVARGDREMLEGVFSQTRAGGQAEAICFAALRQFYKKPTAIITPEN